MIYFVYIFGISIIATICFIAYYSKWIIIALFERIAHHNWLNKAFTPPIIERAYRAIDYRAQFVYIPLKQYNKQPFTNYLHHVNEGAEVIDNERHMEYLVEKQAHELTRKMISDGIFEITDQRDDKMPLHRVLKMRIKVYKPENLNRFRVNH